MGKQHNTYVAIDNSNLYRAMRKNFWIDFQKLYDYLIDLYGPDVDIHFYGCVDTHPSNERFASQSLVQKKLYTKLESMGYHVHTKPLKYMSSGTKCDMDIEITMDFLDCWEQCDQFILFSGDSDFLRLITDCHKRGITTRVYAFTDNLSWELKMNARHSKNAHYTLLETRRSRIENLDKKPTPD